MEIFGSSGVPYSTTWLENLFGNPGVAYVEVDMHSEFDDDNFVILQGLTKLQELRLNESQITDTGLEHLQEFTGIQELGLQGT